MALQNNERRTALILMVITVIVIVSIAVGVTAGFLLRSSPSSSGSEMDDQASDDGSGIISRNSTALSPLDECILRTTQPDELLRFRNAVLDLSPSMSASDIAGLSDVIDNALAGIAGRSALCWMIEEDRYDYITLEDDNVVQRFAMAATYFHFVVSHFKGTTGPASEDEGMIASSRLLSEYNWLSGVHVCDWDFVSCNGVPNNKVTDLFLDSLDLDRRIPSELALLTDLQYLKLTQNKLTGTIPSELTRLKQLEVLSLEHNALTGKIPSGLEKMTRLQDIKLAWNQLTGEIPSQMFTIPFLSWIDLSMNQLEGTLPEDLASGTGVLGFFVDSNRITGMIPDMSSWSNLEVLSLGDNPIDGSFPNLTLCSNLGENTHVYHMIHRSSKCCDAATNHSQSTYNLALPKSMKPFPRLCGRCGNSVRPVDSKYSSTRVIS